MISPLFRSLLFVPGHNEKYINSALKSDADILLLDIEDSVQPKKNKQIARDLILSFEKLGKLEAKTIFPRVNDRESGELLKDLYQLTVPSINGFMFPKSQNGDDIYFYDKILETIEHDKGFPIGTFKMIALIETTSAILNLNDICQRSNRLISIAFGCEDFVTDLQGIHDKQGESIFTARSMVAIAARANNIVPIDTVHIDINNLESLKENIKIAKSLGYEGMMLLHPKEIEIANDYFTPSFDDYTLAKKIIDASQQAIKDGKGVSMDGNQLIGPPIIKNAENIIKKYEMMKK